MRARTTIFFYESYNTLPNWFVNSGGEVVHHQKSQDMFQIFEKNESRDSDSPLHLLFELISGEEVGFAELTSDKTFSAES